MAALKSYALYPYLQVQQLSAALAHGDDSDIDRFLGEQDGTVAAEQLRAQWLAVLADNQRWQQYVKYYRATEASKQQQCAFIDALYFTDQRERALQETEKLWSITDLPDACDDALKRWFGSDRRSEAMIWQRFQLALERKQESLARLLAVQIGDPYKLQAEYALLLYRDPSALDNLLPQIAQQPEASATIALALKNLARRDPDRAQIVWQQNKDALLKAEDSNAVRKEIGRQQIARDGAAALTWLLRNDPNGEDSYLLEWRLRFGLMTGAWSDVEQWLKQLPSDAAQSARWNYWLARSLAAQRDDPSKQKQAGEIFAKLAKERSFYGFLAADLQNTSYQMNDEPIVATVDTGSIAQLPAIARAREFFLLGEYANARREWQSALRAMTTPQQQAAALLAAQWGWYDQGIRSATQSGGGNDLHLRFPLGYRDDMLHAAKNTALPPQWLFAITRQESAFMPDARSPVGALGLMQLMPGTAKRVARGERMRIGIDQLLQPAANIRLGSAYLRDLAQRYDGNRVLATAAYNAGPNRISAILRAQTTAVNADVWIESLPYRETREYVQSVLAFAVIYAQRLGQPIPLLNKSEREIGAPMQIGSTAVN